MSRKLELSTNGRHFQNPSKRNIISRRGAGFLQATNRQKIPDPSEINFKVTPNSKNINSKRKYLYILGSFLGFPVTVLVFLPLFLVLIGIYAVLNFSSLYSVNIKYEYKNVTASRQIEASIDSSSNFKITKLEETDAVSANQATTGEKTVGEKAKGRITIFNATPEIKELKKGTVITCVSAICNGLVFTAVNDLNLGPGNSINDYEITASDIGENYNLAINTGRFKVANFNSTTEIIASNIEAISGGTPKNTVKVVSAADIKAVEEKASNDLKNILIGKIKGNTNYNSKFIISDSSFVMEKLNVETDKEGTEAEVINTNISAKGIVDGFPKEQIQVVLDEIKKDIIPSGYYLDEKLFNSSAKVISSTPGKITIEVMANGIVRPVINIEEIKKNISGKSLSESTQEIQSTPNIKSHEFEYSPSAMPEFLRRVPVDSNRIQIRLIAEGPKP